MTYLVLFILFLLPVVVISHYQSIWLGILSLLFPILVFLLRRIAPTPTVRHAFASLLSWPYLYSVYLVIGGYYLGILLMAFSLAFFLKARVSKQHYQKIGKEQEIWIDDCQLIDIKLPEVCPEIIKQDKMQVFVLGLGRRKAQPYTLLTFPVSYEVAGKYYEVDFEYRWFGAFQEEPPAAIDYPNQLADKTIQAFYHQEHPEQLQDAWLLSYMETEHLKSIQITKHAPLLTLPYFFTGLSLFLYAL